MAQTNPFRIGDWLPFWSSLILFALGWFTILTGGYSFLLVIAVVWYVVPILDQIMSKAKSNVDPETGENYLAPFLLITRIFFACDSFANSRLSLSTASNFVPETIKIITSTS